MIEYIRSEILASMPDLVKALVVFLAGVAIAFIFRKLSVVLITKLAQASSVQVASLGKSKYIASFANIVSKIVFWSAFVISASMVLQIFGIKIVEEWLKRITEFTPNLFGALLMIGTGFVLARFLRDILRETPLVSEMGVSGRITNVIYYGICFVALLMGIGQLGINIGFLTSSILVVLSCILLGGAISFGIGSAPIVTDILSTFYIRKRIKVGQQIMGEQFSGTVVEIGSTCVYLKTDKGVETIPSRMLNDMRFTISHARGS